MRHYAVVFWDHRRDVWPAIAARLETAGAAFRVVRENGPHSLVVECPESTALILRDRDEVQSLKIDKRA